MINILDKKIGDKFYCVKIIYNTFNNKKIKTVIDGIEWFRYEKPKVEYIVESYVLIGKVTYNIEGEVINKEEYETVYSLENYETKEKCEVFSSFDTNYETWFDTYKEAVSFKTLKNGELNND